MPFKRAHILLPVKLAREIDSLVGPRGRSAFLVKTASEAVRRAKLLRFLESDVPSWSEASAPDIGNDAGRWVRKIRKESDFAPRKKKRRNSK